MFKKFLLVITTIVVLFTFVTYQPQKAEAFAGTAVKFVAQQTLKAVTKVSIDSTFQKMLVKELLDETAENYAKKTGMKVVEHGGQKLLVKSSMNETEKVLLKKEIDSVIDKKVYGNAPSWVKFVDWFIGVGAVVLFADALYATITGDFNGFLAEILTDAMRNLGWLETAVPKNPDGSDPSTNPIVHPSDSPIANPDRNIPIPNYTRFVTLQDDSSSGKSYYSAQLNIADNDYADKNGYVSTFESMYQNVSDSTRFPMPTNLNDFSPFVIGQLQSGYLTLNSPSYIFPVVGYNFTVRYGDTVLYDGVPTSSTFGIELPSGFDYHKYNKVIHQRQYFDGTSMRVYNRFLLISTLNRQPMLSAISSMPYTDKPSMPSQLFSYKFTVSGSNVNHVENPLTMRFGIHSNYKYALDVSSLPSPTIVPDEVVTPLLNTNTGKIAVPQKSILPEGYTYDPQDQVIKNPTGDVVQDPSTIPTFTPDPVLETTPDGLVVDGTPVDVPVPPSGAEPPVDGGGSGDFTTGDPKEINWAKLKGVPMILTKKFPFSLPWDAKRFMEGVFGNIPAADEISFKIDSLMGIHFGLDITLPSYFDDWFDFARTATTILFDIGLIYALYRLLGGAS